MSYRSHQRSSGPRSQVLVISEEPQAYYVFGMIIVVLNLFNIVYIVPGIVALLQILAMIFVHKSVLKPGEKAYADLALSVFFGSLVSILAVFVQLFSLKKKNPLLGEDDTIPFAWAGMVFSVVSLASLPRKDISDLTQEQREEMERKRRKEMEKPVEVNGQNTNIGEPVDNNEDSKSSKESSTDPEKGVPIDYIDPSKQVGKDAPGYF